MHSYLNKVIDSCESTNNLLKKISEQDIEDRSWISSRLQTNGKGRLGRSWISESGNLFLSLILKDVPNEIISWIPHFTSVLLCDAICEIKPEIKPVIKWPNDVGFYQQGIFQKGAGILCEGVFSLSKNHIIVGIGVNCNAEIHTDRETTCFFISENDLRVSLINKLKKFPLNDFKFIEDLKVKYNEYSILKKDIKIEWNSLKDLSEVRNGVFLRFGEFGELILTDSENKEISLYSEEIKLKI